MSEFSLADVLGIRFEDPFGARQITVESGHTQVEIGMLVHIDGVMHVVPKHGITNTETGVLHQFAEGAYFDNPEEDPSWSHSVVDGVARWTAYVSAVYPRTAIATTAAELIDEVAA
ncbi:hypothetical protein [Rhodococcus sp. NPDC127528]|uniref:hypothetical protein n=1 Tax=unclassified Rhodococcus (in: high G+C Gram-positive bacteria) TaxID=192944 RepID=UPI003631BC39